MDQIGNEIKKVLQAGLGAVAVGVEKTQEVMDTLSQKGEPIYEQAKSAVCDAAGKIKKAVADSGIADIFSSRPEVAEVVCLLRQMTQEELDQVRQELDAIYPTRPRNEEAMEEEASSPAEKEQAEDAPNPENAPAPDQQPEQQEKTDSE